MKSNEVNQYLLAANNKDAKGHGSNPRSWAAAGGKGDEPQRSAGHIGWFKDSYGGYMSFTKQSPATFTALRMIT